MLSQVKLIAEPWDVGPGGYQVGNFPVLWTEWNGLYRDEMRDFWRGGGRRSPSSPPRFTGSSDLYEDDGRRPYASINFITAHDGFTLADLVSYNDKHNEANCEDNRDGTDDNRSWNCGVEGPTDDPEILALRPRQQRNFLATLLLSQGVPMLLGGDEMGRTPGRQQQRLLPGQRDLAGSTGTSTTTSATCSTFTRRLIALRRAHPVVPPARLLRRHEPDAPGCRTSGGSGADGREMARRDWRRPDRPAGRVPERRGDPGRRRPPASRCIDDSFVLLVNAGHEDVMFRLPPRRFGNRWCGESPRSPMPRAGERRRARGAARGPLGHRAEARSVMLLMTGLAPPTASSSDPASRSPTRRGLRAVPARLGVSHLYLSPSSRRAAARRTATT